jgi:hypothetical protein
MKYAAIAIVLFSTASAFAATDYPIEQRRAMLERSCITNAPEAWKVGDAARAEWIASCRREAQ